MKNSVGRPERSFIPAGRVRHRDYNPVTLNFTTTFLTKKESNVAKIDWSYHRKG
ncbi:MAG: hypothetical protein ABGZ23_13190 [Fuerstiella sp.]